jgi:hypothetical protein
MGEYRYGSTIRDLSTRWKRVVSFMHWLLEPRGRSRRQQLDRRLGGPHSLSGRCGVEKGSKSFSVCGALNAVLRFAENLEEAILYAVVRSRNSVTSEKFDIIVHHDVL